MCNLLANVFSEYQYFETQKIRNSSYLLIIMQHLSLQ